MCKGNVYSTFNLQSWTTVQGYVDMLSEFS